MRRFANLLLNTGLVFVIFIVLARVGTPQLLAQDLCPPSPAYTPDFSSNQSCLALNGTPLPVFAGGDGNPVVLQLTTSTVTNTASAWYRTPQVVQNGFTTNFQFQFTNSTVPPADGIAFVIQNSNLSALGFSGDGGSLGYGDADTSTDPSTGTGIPNSLAIEFDTFQNAWDPAANESGNVSHVAVQSCGAAANTSHHGQSCGVDGPNSTLGLPVLTSSTLADGNVHTVTIKYSAAPPANIHVILDGTDIYPEGVSVDLTSIGLSETGTAYVGFTGATGAAYETQSILSWTFSSTSSNPETTFTTPPQTTAAGGSNSFTDPGGSGTKQTYAFPTTTLFNDDNGGSCTSPTMAIQFQYWDPAAFNSSRLPGIPQNPNWCSVPGNPGLACTTPVPAGTTCAPLSANGKCVVEEAQCFCGGTQLAHCNVTGGTSGPIVVSNLGSSNSAINPGLAIGDDGQNNWAIMPQGPDGSTCTTNCTTQKLNTDITILDVNQPDFSLTATSPLNLGLGGSGSSTVNLTALNGFNSPVTLSVTGAPAVGVTASLGSITPASGFPASAPLTVNVAPSVLPTSFTLDVQGVSGSLSHFAFVTVNVVASTSSISNLIGSLLNAGCIDNSGIANALTSKLSASQGYISVGKNQDAINTLTAFNNQVRAQSGKHISSTCILAGVAINPATVLTADAQSLITSLRVGMTADPITGYALNSNGVGLQGATVSILSGASTIATAITDVTGFYYFATTNLLTSGSTYSIKVTGFPAGYTTPAPTYSTFTWTGSGQTFNFTLN